MIDLIIQKFKSNVDFFDTVVSFLKTWSKNFGVGSNLKKKIRIVYGWMEQQALSNIYTLSFQAATNY